MSSDAPPTPTVASTPPANDVLKLDKPDDEVAADTREPFVLFRRPPKTGRWLKVIERLLSNEHASEIFDVPALTQLEALCNEAKEVLRKEPNMLPLRVGPGEKMVLVGDVHGQFRDLQTHILSQQLAALREGREDLKFLFLGDYVDRGPHGVEVITLLLALKAEYPDLVYMTRGNHEEAQTCRVYGFLAECRSKLQISAWHMFNGVFNELPLAAVVQTDSGDFFCAHGGISPRLDCLETLQFLNRPEYGQGYPGDAAEGTIIDGLLWSDPADHPGFRANLRGCGFTFGPDTTESFCTTNKMQFICRAHQMVMDGYKWDHNDRLLTIFSAPNYCGINNNAGAIAIVDGDKKGAKVELEFHAFASAPQSPCKLYGAELTSSPPIINTGGGMVGDYFASPPPGSPSYSPGVTAAAGGTFNGTGATAADDAAAAAAAGGGGNGTK